MSEHPLVFLVVGWFGSDEWIEGIYANEQDAEAEMSRLWETRSSEKGPEYANRVKNVGVEEWPVIGGREEAGT